MKKINLIAFLLLFAIITLACKKNSFNPFTATTNNGLIGKWLLTQQDNILPTDGLSPIKDVDLKKKEVILTFLSGNTFTKNLHFANSTGDSFQSGTYALTDNDKTITFTWHPNLGPGVDGIAQEVYTIKELTPSKLTLLSPLTRSGKLTTIYTAIK